MKERTIPCMLTNAIVCSRERLMEREHPQCRRTWTRYHGFVLPNAIGPSRIAARPEPEERESLG